MNTKFKLAFFIFLLFGIMVVATLYLSGRDIAVLNPKGLIALKEFGLIKVATLLSLVVIVPVFILTFFFAWKFRESNTTAKYTPDWDHNTKLEFIWWAIPFAIIFVLALITWQSSHELDPYKPLDTNKKPITIQVVALQWKWLFIYPEEDIATINFVQFPEKTPVNFEITSDAPMNSFWIPSLGGQIYAMSGMSTKLHLIADEVGEFNGSSANISGQGFAGMKFVAKASSDTEYKRWVQLVQESQNILTVDEYVRLAEPSENNPVTYYSWQEDLYDKVLMKYMVPPSLDPKPLVSDQVIPNMQGVGH